MSLARIIRWEVESTSAFNRTMTPEQIMDVLEERVGPKGLRLFEQFLRKVNKLGRSSIRGGRHNATPNAHAAFLADLEEDWRHHGKEIFPILRDEIPAGVFPGHREPGAYHPVGL